MPWYEAFALMIGVVLALMALGLPVALAFVATNILGAFLFLGGERCIAQLIDNSTSALTSFASGRSASRSMTERSIFALCRPYGSISSSRSSSSSAMSRIGRSVAAWAISRLEGITVAIALER